MSAFYAETAATTFDGTMKQVIHQAKKSKDLLPSEHFVDTAYVDAHHLVTSLNEYQPLHCESTAALRVSRSRQVTLLRR
ncbi:MAG: hypothetical protein PUP91_24570 [Rhizonema sp. PD37]|nr:hypothetical protein [Rhizonema sp. PD37]